MKKKFVVKKVLSIVLSAFTIFYIVPNIHAKDPKMKDKIRNELVFTSVLRPDLAERVNTILRSNGMEAVTAEEQKNLNLLFDAIIANILEMLKGINEHESCLKLDVYATAMMRLGYLTTEKFTTTDKSLAQECLNYSLLGAIFGENIELAQELMSKGADPNTAIISREIIINHLPDNLARLIKIHSRTADFVAGFAEPTVTSAWCKQNPLHIAAFSNNLNLVYWLLSEGANINEKDSSESTPLHFAVVNGNLGMIKLLLKMGADVNISNDCMQTPLLIAFMFRRLDIMRLLITQGADVNIKNATGDTVLDYAKRSNDIEVINLLKDCGIDVNVEDKNDQLTVDLSTDPTV